MIRTSSLAFLAIFMAHTATAQFGIEVPEVVVSWDAAVRPAASAPEMTNTFRPGDAAFVTLVANVVEEWRMYSLTSPSGRPLDVTFDALPTGVEVVGSLGETSIKRDHDEGLDEDYTYHDGRARIWQRLEITDAATEGPNTISGSVRFAACREGLCLPTREYPFEVQFTVQK